MTFEQRCAEERSNEFMRKHQQPVDKYKKEDPERAEAVLTALYRGISPLIAAWVEQRIYDDAEILAKFQEYREFLMDVFVAVRGD